VDGKYIGEQLRQAAELAGIPLERPLHTLRHSYARALRRVEAPLEGVQAALDHYDGSHVQLAPEKRFHEAVAQLVQPERLPRLTQEQAEVLAIVVMDGMATRRRIEEVRGAATLSIGPEGPLSLPSDSSETLALLLSRGLLCAERDDHANGRPLVYGPTPRRLLLLGVETLEEARGRMRGTSHCSPELSAQSAWKKKPSANGPRRSPDGALASSAGSVRQRALDCAAARDQRAGSADRAPLPLNCPAERWLGLSRASCS
jgi:chromosome segregation and condensation protein ScpB